MNNFARQRIQPPKADVNKQPHYGHQNQSITFDQQMFSFLFSTAVRRTTLQ